MFPEFRDRGPELSIHFSRTGANSISPLILIRSSFEQTQLLTVKLVENCVASLLSSTANGSCNLLLAYCLFSIN